VAERPVAAGKWTHCAVTRDAAGRVALYLDGEPAGQSAGTFTGRMEDLEIGRANRPGGTAADLLEFRVWDRARSAAEIARDLRTRLPEDARPPGLVFRSGAGGEDLRLQKGAALAWTADFPELLTPEAAAAL